jgi:NADH:ubiquinone oxidoreductase subunit 2 (subunit N)
MLVKTGVYCKNAKIAILQISVNCRPGPPGAVKLCLLKRGCIIWSSRYLTTVFKAVLFLAAGGVLHSMADQQDMRRLGGLVNVLPFTYVVMLAGSLSLMAVPYLTGFYSKDLILESGYAAFSLSGHVVY